MSTGGVLRDGARGGCSLCFTFGMGGVVLKLAPWFSAHHSFVCPSISRSRTSSSFSFFVFRSVNVTMDKRCHYFSWFFTSCDSKGRPIVSSFIFAEVSGRQRWVMISPPYSVGFCVTGDGEDVELIILLAQVERYT